MSADILLQHLEKVKRTGQGKWLACCPSHGDKTPSLSIRELDDGRVLVHCFAQCSVEEVLGAVGLAFDALYPPRTDHFVKGEKRPFPAADVLRCVACEAALVAVAAANLMSGMPFSQADRDRVFLAAGRIQSALAAAGLSHG